MNRKVSPKLVALTFGVLILLFLISFYVLGWTEPGQSPPGGNVPTPLNVGSASQYKSGALGIGGLFRAYSSAIFDGNVGIGTTNPKATLQVGTMTDAGSWFRPLYVQGYSQVHTAALHNEQGYGVAIGGLANYSYGSIQAANFKASGSARYVNLLLNSDGGNVGIGTTAPTQKLDVAGYVKGQSGLCIGNDCRSSWPSPGATISGYCIQCWHSRFGWGNEACASFGNWTPLTIFGDDNNDRTGCRIRIY